MGLSRFQGNSMTIKYARKATKENELSYAEIQLLKSKGDSGTIRRYEHLEDKKQKNKTVKTQVDKAVYDRINKRHPDPQGINDKWSSVQERSNDIALRCLGYNKNQEENK